MKKYSLLMSTLLLCSCANFPKMQNADVNKEPQISNTDKAIIALVKGDIDSAMLDVAAALKENPKDPYALMVNGIVYDILGVPHKARRYYEDIIEYKYNDMSLFGNFTLNAPRPLNDVALDRLRAIEVSKVPFAIHGTEIIQPEVNNIFEDNKGARPNLPSSYSKDMNAKDNLSETMYIKSSNEFKAQPVNLGERTFNSDNKTVKTVNAGEQIFTGNDKNIVGRFITFKRLFEEGLITKDEYFSRRGPNLGGLMPLSNPQPSIGIDRPIPDPEVIVDRLKALKTAFEIKAISAREYASERDLILDALLPPSFKDKMVPPNPPNDILEGAEAIRRLEVLKTMGLISKEELSKEKEEIEKVVQFGLNPKPQEPTIVAPAKKTTTKPRKIIPGVTPPRSLRK